MGKFKEDLKVRKLNINDNLDKAMGLEKGIDMGKGQKGKKISKNFYKNTKSNKNNKISFHNDILYQYMGEILKINPYDTNLICMLFKILFNENLNENMLHFNLTKLFKININSN